MWKGAEAQKEQGVTGVKGIVRTPFQRCALKRVPLDFSAVGGRQREAMSTLHDDDFGEDRVRVTYDVWAMMV